jgi:hypothetical protein
MTPTQQILTAVLDLAHADEERLAAEGRLLAAIEAMGEALGEPAPPWALAMLTGASS